MIGFCRFRLAFDLNGCTDPTNRRSLACNHIKGRAREPCVAVGDIGSSFDDLAISTLYPSSAPFARRITDSIILTLGPGVHDALVLHCMTSSFTSHGDKSKRFFIVPTLRQNPTRSATLLRGSSPTPSLTANINASILAMKSAAHARCAQITTAPFAHHSANSGYARLPRDDTFSTRQRGYTPKPRGKRAVDSILGPAGCARLLRLWLHSTDVVATATPRCQPSNPSSPSLSAASAPMS